MKTSSFKSYKQKLKGLINMFLLTQIWICYFPSIILKIIFLLLKYDKCFFWFIMRPKNTKNCASKPLNIGQEELKKHFSKSSSSKTISLLSKFQGLKLSSYSN